MLIGSFIGAKRGRSRNSRAGSLLGVLFGALRSSRLGALAELSLLTPELSGAPSLGLLAEPEL
eukprot:10878469-Alexandrium_andersonii.AAC.1